MSEIKWEKYSQETLKSLREILDTILENLINSYPQDEHVEDEVKTSSGAFSELDTIHAKGMRRRMAIIQIVAW